MSVDTWEIRSHEFGTSLRGVLLRNAPTLLNNYIHRWHRDVVLSIAKENDRILDVGCGWGRLTKELQKKFPSIDVTGIDVSQNYVRMFKQLTGKDAFVKDISELDDELGKFSLILCVSVLLYLDEEWLENTIENLIDNLTPNGKLIIIEGNSSGMFHNLSRLVYNILGVKPPDTGGKLSSPHKLETLFSIYGGSIITKKSSLMSMYNAYIIERNR